MQVIPRHSLPSLLRKAGLAAARDFPLTTDLYRLTVREQDPVLHVSGPHRKIVYPDGRIEGPFPVADRPALSGFFPRVFSTLGATAVLATVPEGTFWLNNKAQANYLYQVPDAQRVSRFLRRRGLTDRFQGGFVIRADQFVPSLPWLAANTFSGGADVLFSVLAPSSLRLTALACHHFDIHFTSPTDPALSTIAELAAQHGLLAESLSLPELPDWSETWFSDENAT